MSSEFETDFVGIAAPDLLGYFGEPVVYTAPGGTGVSCSVVWHESEGGDDATERGLWRVRTAEVTGPVSSVSEPVEGATILKGGLTWVVTRILGASGGLWTVTVEWREHSTVEAENYRR